jgi:choline dehydrogenase-like flavoprotein
VIKSDADLQADREELERLREEKQQKARQRKEKMKELEKRAEQLCKKSDMELADIARKQALREMAEKQIDYNSDVVKLMNSMAQRATAFTIRDQQLEEKHRIEHLTKDIERREG